MGWPGDRFTGSEPNSLSARETLHATVESPWGRDRTCAVVGDTLRIEFDQATLFRVLVRHM